MRIIISPAKKMRIDTDSLPVQALPVFLKDAENIADILRNMSEPDLKKLWKCNDSITELNIRRLKNMDLHRCLTPAILAYEGIQYQYMAPNVLTGDGMDYIQEHLRILSGFYGILRPFDGITPYRLEMQAKLNIANAKDLYAYWGSRLARSLFSETDCVLNLASKEYSVCISKFLPDNVRFISFIFGEERDGKIIEKGTMCKMARGEMVRYLAENQITNLDEIKNFSGLGYRYDSNRSNINTYVFVFDG